MSKIGKQPIKLPEGVTAVLDGDIVRFKGAKAEMDVKVLAGVKAAVADGTVTFELVGTSKQAKSNWGTTRAIAQNAVSGLKEGFEKTLILEGVGYRVTKEGENLSLALGFSHPVKYAAPQGITFEVEKNSILKIKGTDRQKVGQVAAEIRAMKKPEPYKGKGFHYSDEVVRRKSGKKAAAATGSAS
ncbi:50S ribosomal protein L6 [Patescibacteria group bacterium]|nr:50S ribosomal protein L6 [Patescibacteria group bacterium]